MKTCANKQANDVCVLHNLFCDFPKCEKESISPVLIGTPPNAGVMDWADVAKSQKSRVAQLEQQLIAVRTELAEAKAELERLRCQQVMGRVHNDENQGKAWLNSIGRLLPDNTPLYAEPKPPTHPGATHCDNCGCTWLDNGLNPVGCPYCNLEAIPTGSHSPLVATRKICGNCESAMPKGCGGVFKDQGSACWLNTDATTLPDCKGESK